jgi:transposase InsO family protein
MVRHWFKNHGERVFRAQVPLNRAIEDAIGSSPMASHITYIKAHEGWLYLSVVIDLFSRPSPWASDQWRHHGSRSAGPCSST